MLVILLFSIVIIVNAEEKCPEVSIQAIFNESICLYYGTQKLAYLTAEEECRKRNGHLIKTKNMMEDIYLSQHAFKYFKNSLTSDFWFGLNKMENNNEWGWIDGTKLNYKNWSPDEPRNHTDNICGAVAFAGGHWSAQDCYKVKPFVCSFNSQ